jgi:hypothetical protein
MVRALWAAVVEAVAQLNRRWSGSYPRDRVPRVWMVGLDPTTSMM